MSKPKLFVSHVSREHELAELLKTYLAKDFLKALDVFVSSDRTTLKPGDNWLDELKQALSECQIEIVLYSRDSVGRPWVNFEAGAGWIRNIKVVPVCHSGMTRDNLPLPMNLLQAIEASDPESLRQLYHAVAQVLEMDVPEANFEIMADAVRQLERKYLRAEGGITTIESPRILCAASAYFSRWPDIGFDQDVAVLEQAFPGRITVERELTATRLRNLLSKQSFDVLHLVLPINRDTGALIFSPVDPNHIPTSACVDSMPAEAFSGWVDEAKTSLVVMATCNALALAVDVAPVANMIAINTEIRAHEMEMWGGCFYGMLADGFPLFKSFAMTRSNYPDIPMRLVRHKDVAFSR